MTLVELAMALAVTALIGTAVATMLVSMSDSSLRQSQARDLAVSEACASTRLGRLIRMGKKVLAQGEDYLVLWIGDTRPNALPDLSELCRIDYDGTDAIAAYTPPTGLAEADDVTYDFAATDFCAVTTALKGSPLLPGRTLATGVTGWTVRLNKASPQNARLVAYRLKLRIDGVSEELVGAAALRK